jgi:hypothetical protein
MFETLITDPKERAQHEGSVHDLARESGLPEENVIAVYERALAQLRREARVTDFLPVLTRRVVKDSLRLKPLR